MIWSKSGLICFKCKKDIEHNERFYWVAVGSRRVYGIGLVGEDRYVVVCSACCPREMIAFLTEKGSMMGEKAEKAEKAEVYCSECGEAFEPGEQIYGGVMGDIWCKICYNKLVR